MIYLSARESNHGVPSRFRKLDPKAHELRLFARNQVSQRSKADIPPLWLNHMQFQETERIPAGYFLRHLPLCLMQSKSLPDAIETLCPTRQKREFWSLFFITGRSRLQTLGRFDFPRQTISMGFRVVTVRESRFFSTP